ncbi:MAG: esterase YqiA, partial [Burkholderiales bacterium]|nr:esterase YqiA [Burkholderiales bacterium]
LIASHIERLGPENVTLVGSSLGGFYSTWASSRYGCSAVLINPAVRPHRLLAAYLGPQQNMYTGERYLLEASHTDELARLEPAAIDPSRFWLLVETADETLDYRDAVRYYAGVRQTVVQGGDHSLQCWGELLPEVVTWAGINA